MPCLHDAEIDSLRESLLDATAICRAISDYERLGVHLLRLARQESSWPNLFNVSPREIGILWLLANTT